MAEAVKGLDVLLKEQGSIDHGSPRKGTTLKWVDDRACEHLGRQTRGSNPFEDLGKGMEQYNNP